MRYIGRFIGRFLFGLIKLTVAGCVLLGVIAAATSDQVPQQVYVVVLNDRVESVWRTEQGGTAHMEKIRKDVDHNQSDEGEWVNVEAEKNWQWRRRCGKMAVTIEMTAHLLRD